MSIIKGVLRRGVKGVVVGNLQTKLVSLGYNLTIDSVFGKATELAVRDFQHKKGLDVDGLVGANTLRLLSDVVVAHGVSVESDLIFSKLAERLGVEVPMVRAVLYVESNNSGFNDDGTPIILFERHWMRRQCISRGIDVTKYIEWCPGIINEKRGGYGKGSDEHNRLNIAKSIDEDSAYESASWGAFQIMGFHWESLGFKSVQAFVSEMSNSTESQYEIFVDFILNDNRLLNSMREKDFVSFARIYNGPKYAEFNYHIKLEAAYNRFSFSVL